MSVGSQKVGLDWWLVKGKGQGGENETKFAFYWLKVNYQKGVFFKKEQKDNTAVLILFVC